MARTKNRTAADRSIATSPPYESVFASLLRRGSFWLFAVALVYACEFLWTFSYRVSQIDFSHYYVSAVAMRAGIDPYTTDLTPIATSFGLDLEEMKAATYPPTFVLCFEPLTLLPPVPAYWAWTAMNVAFLAIALYLLLDGLPPDNDLRLALAGLAILYAPVTDNFFFAQTQILILLLLVLFMRWMKSGQYALAGLALAFAALIKVFPAIVLGYLLLRRQVKAIAYTGAFLVIGGVATFALVGVERSSHFLRAFPFLTSPYFFDQLVNVSLAAIVSHLIWTISGDARLEPVRQMAIVAADLALLALTVRATLRTSKRSNDGDEAVFGLWVVTTVLLSPTAWMHYLVLFLLPYAVLMRLHLRGAASPVVGWLALVSYAIAELQMAAYIGFGQLADWTHRMPAWVPLPSMFTWHLSLLLAYAGFYLLAVQTMPVRAAVPRAIGANRSLRPA